MSLITVVIPTRDRPDRLTATVDSIRGQEIRDGDHLEVIIVDDCSDDPVGGLSGCTVVRHDRHRGVSAARNTGWRAAHGEFVAFCDDDDLWRSKKIMHQVDAIGDSDWCVCDAVVETAGGEVRHVEQLATTDGLAGLLRKGNLIPGGGSGVLVRREALDALDGFDEDLAVFADWDLWLRLARTRPAHVGQALVLSVEHDGQMALDAGPTIVELLRVVRKHDLPNGGKAPDAMLVWVFQRSRRSGRMEAVRSLRSIWPVSTWRLRARFLGSLLQPGWLRRRRASARVNPGQLVPAMSEIDGSI